MFVAEDLSIIDTLKLLVNFGFYKCKEYEMFVMKIEHRLKVLEKC